MIKSSQSLIFFATSILATLFLFVYYLHKTASSVVRRSNQKVDVVIFALLFSAIALYYISRSAEDKTHILSYMLYTTKETLDKLSTPLYMAALLGVFYVVLHFAKVPMSEDRKPFSVHFVEFKLYAVIATCLIVQAFSRLLGIAVIDDLYAWVVKHFPYLRQTNQK